MKERSPVLFNGAMVRAILDDRKTQTRRIVKPQPGADIVDIEYEPEADLWLGNTREDNDLGYCSSWSARSPLGKPGDRLWVRETFAECGGQVVYRADNPDGYPGANFQPWRSPLAMPRHLSRLTLEVESVRVQRLQDISEEDARAEGVEQCGGFMTTWGCWMNYGKSGPSCKTARESFQTLWISVYGAESWAANPWVWVTEFRRVTQTL